MSKKKTIEDFEHHVIKHGADPSTWTQEARFRFEQLLSEPTAKLILEREMALSRYFDANEQLLSEDASENAFLGRLIDIPAGSATATVASGAVSSRLFDRLFERVFSLSPMGLTSQLAGFGAILLIGFLVGMTNPDALYQEVYGEERDVVDLSDSYFADAGFYLDEGGEQ